MPPHTTMYHYRYQIQVPYGTAPGSTFTAMDPGAPQGVNRLGASSEVPIEQLSHDERQRRAESMGGVGGAS